MPDDKIQREIEDILNRLDAFVPEESVASRMRRRSSDAAGGFGRAIIAPLARISLRQVMLTALVLVVLGFLAMRVHPLFGRWLLVGGLILFLTSFALSFFSRGPTKTERRWRGRPMELDEPSLGDRLRAWLQAKRRPRR
jgi:hypothetical protein